MYMDSVTTPKNAAFIQKPCPGLQNGVEVKFVGDDLPICLNAEDLNQNCVSGECTVVPKLNASGSNATMYYQFETETDGTKKRYIYKKFRDLYSFNKEARILRLLKRDFQEGYNNDDECHIITYEKIIRPDKIIKFPYCRTDLDDYIFSELPPTLEQGIDIFKDLLQTLDKLHKKGYVHLDIKPENIVVKCDGPDDKTPYFIDFGYTRKIDPRGMDFPAPCGTPLYVDPYFVENKEFSTKTDMWSMGIVLFILCLHHPPYEIERLSTTEIISKSTTITDKINLYVPNIPNEEIRRHVTTCLEGLLQLKPDNRWTASQALEELKKINPSEPVITQPSPTPSTPQPPQPPSTPTESPKTWLNYLRSLTRICFRGDEKKKQEGGDVSASYPKAYHQYKKYRKYKQRYVQLLQQKKK